MPSGHPGNYTTLMDVTKDLMMDRQTMIDVINQGGTDDDTLTQDPSTS